MNIVSRRSETTFTIEASTEEMQVLNVLLGRCSAGDLTYPIYKKISKALVDAGEKEGQQVFKVTGIGESVLPRVEKK